MADEETNTMLNKLVETVQGYKKDEQTGNGGWIGAAIALIERLYR